MSNDNIKIFRKRLEQRLNECIDLIEHYKVIGDSLAVNDFIVRAEILTDCLVWSRVLGE